MIDLQQVRKFVDYEKDRFDLDRKAIEEARDMANGEGWRQSFSNVKTTLRHKVRVDAVNQIINKICSKFTSNPFRFLSQNQQLKLDYSSYDTAIALAFRDSIVTGQGFVYVDYAAGKARRLHAGSVMMDSSLSSPYVICVEKEPNDGGRQAGDNLGMGYDIIEHDSETEHLVFLVHQKTEKGIAIAKVAVDSIVAEEILPISEYPIIRIAAEETWVKGRKTFRGLYHKAMGMSDLIDAAFSRVATNILTAPRMKYWVPSSLAASENFAKIMSEMSKQDSAYVPYDAYDDQQRPIPAPIRDEGRIFVEELVAVTDKMIEYVNMLFGFEASENADTGNKTAQEILFRKENQNANYSQYLFSLSVAMQAVCKIYRSIGYGEVSIISGPYENIYRQTSQQAILAINDYCTAQPQRAAIAPLLIRFSSLDEQTKIELGQIIQSETNIQQIASNAQEMQQQLKQMQGLIQALQQQNAALRQQQLSGDKAISADLATEQMRLADKKEERAFKAAESEKDREMELFKLEIENLTP